MTQKDAIAKLAKVGFKLRRDSEWNEYLVYPIGESSKDAYRTDNLEDAVGTGLLMARLQAPKPARRVRKVVRLVVIVDPLFEEIYPDQHLMEIRFMGGRDSFLLTLGADLGGTL